MGMSFCNDVVGRSLERTRQVGTNLEENRKLKTAYGLFGIVDFLYNEFSSGHFPGVIWATQSAKLNKDIVAFDVYNNITIITYIIVHTVHYNI